MKEYIESMKDSRDPFSGETYLLPEELAKKYADAEALEIEYLSSKQSGLVHPDDLAVIKAEAMTAGEVYRQAITERMPADVQAHVAFDRRAHGLENLKEPTELTIQQQEDLLRISDISLHRIENEYIYLSFHIQCRVDGRQQPAKPIYANDHMLFCNNQISKEELAMLYFGNALHAEREHYGPELDEKMVKRYARAAYSDNQELEPWVKEMQRELDKNPDISHTIMQNGKTTQWEWMLDSIRQCIHIGHRVDNTQDSPIFDTTMSVDYYISKPLAENIDNISQEFSKNISDRIDFLVRDFQYWEDTLEQPLYAEVQIRWNEDGKLNDEIIKLVPDRDEESIFYNADGLNGLKKLMELNNGQDFTVKKVNQLYGRTFNIAVVDYLTRNVNIQARSEEEAMKKLDKEYYRGNIVLGSEDFNRRDVLQLETGLLRPEPVRLMATPEGTYTLTVQEILQHNEKIDAKDLPSAIEKVEDMLKNYEIIVGSEDDYVETNYIQHARLIDNSLETPVEIPLADIADFQRQLAEAYPHGMTVHLQNESVEHLKQFPAGMDLNGLVNAPEQELLSAHGSLHAEARLMPDDYAHVYPDTATYSHEKLASECDTGIAAATLYLHQHPDMDGGRVNLNMNPQIMKRIYVEDMPLPNLLHAIEDRNIQTDKELIQFRDEVKNLDRISEVSLYKHNSGSMMLRCKIDGEQQSGRAVPVPYLRSWYEGDISKREMAAKMFSEELKQSANQEENRGIKR